METAYSWLDRNVPGVRKRIVEKKVLRKKISYWSDEEEPTIRGTRCEIMILKASNSNR